MSYLVSEHVAWSGIGWTQETLLFSLGFLLRELGFVAMRVVWITSGVLGVLGDGEVGGDAVGCLYCLVYYIATS